MAAKAIGSDEIRSNFKCTSCGFASPVLVAGGSGSSDDPRADAAELLPFAACKQCGRREASGRYWRDNLLLAALVAAGLYGLRMIAPEGKESATLVPLLQVVGGLILVLAAYLRWMHVTEAGSRVRFVEADEETEDAPRPRKKKRKKKPATTVQAKPVEADDA